MTGFINETKEIDQFLDAFWNVQTNLSGTYGLLEELWELMLFEERKDMPTSTENFLKFCMNQMVENNTWLPVDDVSECTAAFTKFKNHFWYILSYSEVKLPDELHNLHRLYGLHIDNNHYDEDHNNCTCIHDQSLVTLIETNTENTLPSGVGV